MNTSNKLFQTGLLLLSSMFALNSCSSTTPEEKKNTAAMEASSEPGGIVVKTYRETATVKNIDKANRKLTVMTSDGATSTIVAGPEVVNFPQIAIGDQIIATVTEQLVVYVRKPGESSNDGAAAAVALAPVGAKPGIVVAGTEEITAKVTAIDVKNQRATLQFPNGNSRTFNVRKDVDLTKQNVGAEVVIRVTAAVAISVEKP